MRNTSDVSIFFCDTGHTSTAIWTSTLHNIKVICHTHRHTLHANVSYNFETRLAFEFAPCDRPSIRQDHDLRAYTYTNIIRVRLHTARVYAKNQHNSKLASSSATLARYAFANTRTKSRNTKSAINVYILAVNSRILVYLLEIGSPLIQCAPLRLSRYVAHSCMCAHTCVNGRE